MIDTRRISAVSMAAAAVVLMSGCSWIGIGADDRPDSALQRTSFRTAGEVGSGGTQPLRPGDHIRVSSWREEGLTDEFVVDEDGTVVLPLLGPRDATSKPAEQLKNELVRDYESRFRNHTVGVTLLRRVSILGAVVEPGVYHVDPTMTISEAVALAGGPNDQGKLNEVTIFRNGQELDAELSQAIPLRAHVQSGDQIVVPKRNWFVRNAGLLIGSSISAVTIILTQIY